MKDLKPATFYGPNAAGLADAWACFCFEYFGQDSAITYAGTTATVHFDVEGRA